MSTDSGFKIQLNGEPYVVSGDAHLVPFIQSLKLRPGRVAVEINHAVVPKANWAATVLRAIRQSNPRPRYAVGEGVWGLSFIRRFLPWSAQERVIRSFLNLDASGEI